MNRSSSRKSFLDDLLGDDNDTDFASFGPPTVTSTQRPSSGISEAATRKSSKSVRFSEGLDNKPATSSAKSSSADWLGLATEEEDEIDKDTRGFSRKSTESSPSWLNTSSSSSSSKVAERTTPSVISGIKTVVEAKPTEKQIAKSSPFVLTPSSPETRSEQQRRSSLELQSLSSVASLESSNLLMQTQLKVLEVEKSHLSQMLDQSKLAHQQELQLMKEMHDKQLEMTKSFLEKQQESTKEEKDRRIRDLTVQVNSLEEERNELSNGYKSKLKEILEERDAEIGRLKERHASQVNHIRQEHEQEVDRLKKSKDTEVDTVVSMYSLTESLESLLSRWKSSTIDMQTLQETLMEKQGKFINEVVDSVSTKESSLSAASSSWSSMKKELEEERDRLKQLEQDFMLKMEEHNHSLSLEQKRLSDERSALLQERRSYERERKEVQDKLRDQEEKLRQDQQQYRLDLDRLKMDQINLQERIREFTVKEKEGLQDFLKQSLEFESERLKIEQDRTKLDFSLKDLEVKKSSLKERESQMNEQRAIFQVEKEALMSLAHELKQRADQLEKLSSETIEQKEAAARLQDKADKIKAEADSRQKEIEEQMIQLKIREDYIRNEVKKIQIEWKQMEDTKDSALCSLCSSRLSSAKLRGLQDNNHYRIDYHAQGIVPLNQMTVNHQEGKMMMPSIIDDSSLLVWQISSQAEAALVAEETAFVQRLQQQSRRK